MYTWYIVSLCELAKIHSVYDETKTPSGTSDLASDRVLRVLRELGTSAIKPKQNEGNERLAVTEGIFAFILQILPFSQNTHKLEFKSPETRF